MTPKLKRSDSCPKMVRDVIRVQAVQMRAGEMAGSGPSVEMIGQTRLQAAGNRRDSTPETKGKLKNLMRFRRLSSTPSDAL